MVQGPVWPGSSPMRKVFRSVALSLISLGGGALPVHAQGQAQIIAPGITEALREVKLSMMVGGRVEAVLVREGHRVRRGDLLLYLDRELEELEVERRRLMLDDKSKLNELNRKESTLLTQVAEARKLLESGGVSRKQVEDEEMALQAITAERDALEFAKRREKVELDLARATYERRHLRSPIDGVITKVFLRAGRSIGSNEPVAVVVDVSRVRFLGTFPVSAGVKVDVGQSVAIRLGQDGTAATRQAKVIFVSPTADPASGLVEIISEFNNADGSVRPGVSGQMLLGVEKGNGNRSGR